MAEDIQFVCSDCGVDCKGDTGNVVITFAGRPSVFAGGIEFCASEFILIPAVSRWYRVLGFVVDR